MAAVLIEERKGKTGKVSYRAQVRSTKKGKILERKTKTFPTKTMAQKWADQTKTAMEQKLSDIEAGIHRPDLDLSEITVGELITQYLEHPRIAPDIGRTKYYVLSAMLNYDIADITASKLRADDLISHCEFRLGDDTKPTPQTVYQDVTYLRSVMSIAKSVFKVNASTSYHDEALPTLIDLKLIGRSQKRNRRPTRQELKLMEQHLNARADHHSAKIPFGDILQFSLLTAMRVSEITRIRWSDLDTENRTIIIRDRKDPRNKSGNDHEIPLLGGAFELVMKQKERIDPKEPDLIFPYNPRSISAGWQRVRDKLGIEDLRYHDLRREAASRLAEMGLPINIVARITGHKNINILHNIYAKIDVKEFGKEGYQKYI
ncbi:site-specific integrase [Vibrio cincinnatiensis]|uniref:integrase n=1 Tax=Vibrio TaxID=662 RepID=UPI001EDF1ABD|nr:site-specific integrase [Vibrio cincinnatiensis]HDV5276555.1 tyrosine-type recombinase/integrase [Vibrio cholerae]MCG3767641.1 site-specific integrase [Vibrio cincinnatiensis]HDV5298575.1 tyrosine-type recombinase/integrase [Vibrio cholerae]HDV5306085.1 tyrosine-type recombinase/integrase [Vibrio cholerae]HDV5309747.1 tyrosine-type recombinase/integrase [Vibrio cholerae]